MKDIFGLETKTKTKTKAKAKAKTSAKGRMKLSWRRTKLPSAKASEKLA